MKVKELIEWLQEANPNASVQFFIGPDEEVVPVSAYSPVSNRTHLDIQPKAKKLYIDLEKVDEGR